jgi:hypothetical protein
MEAADDRNAGVSESPCKIIGAQDQIPWAFDRTEETQQWPLEDRSISQIPYLWKKILVLFVAEARGVFSAFGGYELDLWLHIFFLFPLSHLLGTPFQCQMESRFGSYWLPSLIGCQEANKRFLSYYDMLLAYPEIIQKVPDRILDICKFPFCLPCPAWWCPAGPSLPPLSQTG